MGGGGSFFQSFATDVLYTYRRSQIDHNMVPLADLAEFKPGTNSEEFHKVNFPKGSTETS